MTIAAPYVNAGNELVLSLVPTNAVRILDIGCGAGDNARCLLAKSPQLQVVGITHSREEALMARPHMQAVHVIDIESDIEAHIGGPFDLLLFSHVLEHMRDPVAVIRRFLPFLASNGHVIIAVPNTLEWRTRLSLFRGNLNYAEHGILDRTHLRFFTYWTASAELVDPVPELTLITRRGRGSLPFGRLRRRFMPDRWRLQLDEAALNWFPNIVAGEVALLARRSAESKLSHASRPNHE